jgi:hypothetical protein
MMHSDHSQQSAFQNPQQQNSPQGNPNLHQLVQSLLQLAQSQQAAGFGPGSIGQGVYGGFANPFGGGQVAAGWGWGAQQRQLSQQDVSAILQQIAPVLPQIIAQAQQHSYQPMAAFGGGFGGYQRSLSPQDVGEVVRQILPVIPQLVQSMQQQGGPWGAAQPGLGLGPQGLGWQGQAAYGPAAQQNPLQGVQPPRQLTPQDMNEIARQLGEVIQQAYGGQQTGQLRF